MSEHKERREQTLREYIWWGFGGGLFFGIASLMYADQLGSRGLIALPAAALVGSVDGYVLYRTRHWSRRHFTAVVLRTALALGIGLLALSDLLRLTGVSTPREALEMVSLVPVGSLAFAWTSNRKRYNEDRPAPTGRDVAILTGLLALFAAFGWFGYHAAQRVAT